MSDDTTKMPYLFKKLDAWEQRISRLFASQKKNNNNEGYLVMENKQSQNPSKSGSQSSDSNIDKKSSSKVGQDEFDIETKHPSSRDGEVLSGGGNKDSGKDSGSCSTSGNGCGTK